MNPVEETDQEKRITFQLYNHWFGLTDDHALPPLTSLTPEDIAPYKDNMLLIDLRDSDNEPTLQVVGQLLNQDIDQDLNLKYIGDIPRRSLLSRLTDHYMEVLANRSPISFDAEFKNTDRKTILYRGILLPFSDDGENINFILGAIRWITEQERNAARPHKEEKTVTVFSVLQNRLDACRQIVQGESGHIRSRKSLYETLGAVLDFHALCCSSPDNYHKLLTTEGLKAQKRAPFTPTLKLCFGPGYDKTRLTEYAATLSFARKNHLDGARLPDFLHQFPGGIKGCVRAERNRRNGKKFSPENTPGKHGKPQLETLDNIPSLARFDIPLTRDNDNSGEFCLLLARRDGAHVNVIKIVEKDEKILGPMLERLGQEYSD